MRDREQNTCGRVRERWPVTVHGGVRVCICASAVMVWVPTVRPPIMAAVDVMGASVCLSVCLSWWSEESARRSLAPGGAVCEAAAFWWGGALNLGVR